MNIYDIFTAKVLKVYWEKSTQENDAPILQKWFPARKQIGLKLSWIKGYKQNNMVLQPSAFDTKATLRDFAGFAKMEQEMPFFREGHRVGEKDRQEMITLMASNENYAKPLIKQYMDFVRDLIDGAELQMERMRANALFFGSFKVASKTDEGRNVVWDYQYDNAAGEWKANNNLTLLTTATWTKENVKTSDPIADLLSQIEKAKEKRGVILTDAILNTTTLKAMLASESIKKSIDPMGVQGRISQAQLKQYIQDETGLTFHVYDKIFKDEEGTDVKMVQDGYVALLPNSPVGNSVFSTTPEEFDLMGGGTSAQVEVVGNGVAVTTFKEPHPVNVFTVVSMIGLPSFEQMESVYVIKAF